MLAPVLVSCLIVGCSAPADPEPPGERPPPDTNDTGPPALPPPAAGGWVTGPALLEPLQEHAVVALDGEVVVLGGYNDRRQMVDRVEAYDPARGAWRSLAALPEPAHHVNAIVVDGRIFVLGVLQQGFLETAVTWVYDPSLDRWDDGTAPPFDRAVGASTLARIGDEVHVVGGLQAVRPVALHSVYDLTADRWRAEPDSPRIRDHAAGGASGGLVLAVAGRDGSLSSVLGAVDRFDPQTQSWSTGAPVPTARAGVAHAIDGQGRLHVLGGEGSATDPGGVFPQHEVYDPAADRWERWAPMAAPRHGMGATVIDGVLYVPGGAPVQAFGAVDTFDWIEVEEGQ